MVKNVLNNNKLMHMDKVTTDHVIFIFVIRQLKPKPSSIENAQIIRGYGNVPKFNISMDKNS